MMSFQVITLRYTHWNSTLLSEVITRFPVPISITLNGYIMVANKSYAQLLGYSSIEQILHKPVESFLHESDRILYEKMRDNQFQEMTTGKEYPWKILVHGKIRYLIEIPSIQKTENDIAIVSTFIDKTDEVQKAKQLMKEKEKLLAVNRNLLKQLREKDGYFISNSVAMRNVIDKALQLAKSEINIALLGETGTGKTLLAKMIHDAGPRKNKPFITVNCAAIPEALMESAFFGHVKGAFTGADTSSQGFLEVAHEGTLFLDEVAELSPAMQAKLLHAVENKHFTPIGSTVQKACDVRIISATHRNLSQMLQEGKLREDFFYRIFVVDLYLPPLRERREDIPLLIDFFLKRFSGTDTPPSISEHILTKLVNAPWAGNIRELQNVILRYIVTGEITDNTIANPLAKPVHEPGENLLDIEACKATTEKRCILHALQLAKGSKSQAALLLNLNPRTFRRYCARHNI